jgi:predicted AAA+ superfamily ATPase
MEKLQKRHVNLLNQTDQQFYRYTMNTLPWDERLLGIKGARGVGKTTLLLQHILDRYGFSPEAMYISLDNLYFTNNLLSDFVDDFVSKGGLHLFIDEVHKYPGWAIESENIYDLHSKLKITFTGSSLLQILNSRADLSRRALVFNMQGLSFREYINFTLKMDFKAIGFNDLLNNHISIALDILKHLKPLKYFDAYLKAGYYPFFIENMQYYYHRLLEVVNMTIDIELPLMRGVDPANTRKIKQLLYIISSSSPFKPNISKLAQKIGVTRNTLNEYFKILVDSRLLSMLNKSVTGINLLQKPDKIFLENTNIAYAISDSNPDKGNLRETFFLNQLSVDHNVTYPENGDFMIDEKYLFEVGGKNKTRKQIAGIENAFIAADDFEFGYENKIPLWLFGFLY